MTITLPYPPPVNRLYRTVQGRPILSREARAYRGEVYMRCRVARLMPYPENELVSLTLRLYRPRKAGDCDGPIKLLMDCLEGWSYSNDRQVSELHVYRYDDKDNPRVEVVAAAAGREKEARA